MVLIGEEVVTHTFAPYIGRRAVQTAPERISIAKRHGDYLKAKLVELFQLVDLTCLGNNRLMIDNQHVHR